MGLGWVFLIRGDSVSYSIIGLIVSYRWLDRIVSSAGSYHIGWIVSYRIGWIVSGNNGFCALTDYWLDGKDLQEMMSQVFPHQVFLWMSSELDHGHLSMDDCRFVCTLFVFFFSSNKNNLRSCRTDAIGTSHHAPQEPMVALLFQRQWWRSRSSAC